MEENENGFKEQKKSNIKKLKRSRRNKHLFGVCGGFAEYFNIDATIVRILWVIFIFLGGTGLIAYLAAALLMPRSEVETGEKEEKETGDSGVWVIIGWILIIFGFLFLLAKLHFIEFSIKGIDYIQFFYFPWSLIWPLVLIFLGIYIAVGKTKKEKILEKIRDKNLFRSRKNKTISGVCGGIGEYLNLDPTFVRIIWVLISLITGVVLGIVVYFIFVLIVPEETLAANSTNLNEKEINKDITT